MVETISKPKQESSVFETLREQVKELRSKISELRKEGKDPLMADYKLRVFDSKLKFAKATNDKKDLEIVRNLLIEIGQEITEVEEEPLVNVKEDIAEMTKQLFAPKKKISKEKHKKIKVSNKIKHVVLKNPDKYFYLKSGKPLKSIKSLKNYFSKMSDVDFNFHTERHDFSKWIKGVFGESTLANKIRNAHGKKEFIKIIEEAMV